MDNTLFKTGLRFYQNANTDAQTIKEGFIIRQHEYDIIMGDIRHNTMQGSVQHYLLTGRRGSGKSTLLKRIQVEIDTDETLSSRYIAINLAEEQANIYRLFDLLEEIIAELQHNGVEVEEVPIDDDTHVYSQQLFAAIHTAIEKSGKKMVLLLDNIDRIFENLRDDAKLLREYLLNYSDVKIIGGSTRMAEHFWKYNKPFYQFFRELTLPALNREEVKQLMLHWAEKQGLDVLKKFVENRPGQLETVRLLTDGLPRTLQFFVTLVINKNDASGYEYLKQIMDYITPLYQERLNGLPPAQRKVVLQLAFIWESAGAKELAEATRMDNKVVSAQLKQLADKGLVDKQETHNKNHLYRLSERFFNLWLIFTQGSPHEKRRAKYLTIFLENFYDEEELIKLAKEHLQCLEDGKMPAGKAAMLTKAYAQSRFISMGMRDMLIEKTLKMKDLTNDLKIHLPDTAGKVVADFKDLFEKKQWRSAIKKIEEIDQPDGSKEFILGYMHWKFGNKEKAERHLLLALEKQNKSGYTTLGEIYEDEKKFDLAEKYYLLGVENENADAVTSLGIYYDNRRRMELAEKYYLLAVEKNDVIAMFNLANLYRKQKRFELAEKYYLMGVDKNDVDSMSVIANFYKIQKKFEQAEKHYLMAIEYGDTDSIFNIALMYDQLGSLEKAEKYYLMAVEKEDIQAMCNLGVFYNDQGNFELAEQYYVMASNKNEPKAIRNLGLLYMDLKKFDLAEDLFLKALKFDTDINLYYNLAYLYFTTNKKRENAFSLINKIPIELHDGDSLKLLIGIKAWNNNLININDDFNELLKEGDIIYAEKALEYLLYFHQVNVVNKLFQSQEFGETLRERYLPIYYANQMLLANGNSVDLRVPPELLETVNELLKSIKYMQAYYAEKPAEA